MLQPWPRKFNITQVLSPRLLLQKKNRTQNRFVPEIFYRFCSTLTCTCTFTGQGKFREKIFLQGYGKSGKFYLFERSQGGVKSCLNLVEALFVMRNADPFWQLIDTHKHYYFPCVIQVTLWIKLLPFSWFWMFHILCYILWTWNTLDW